MQTDGSQCIGSTRLHRKPGLKHWMPNLDCHGEPQVFQAKLRAFINALALPFTCSSFEAGLLKAGEQGGISTKRRVSIRPSQGLIGKNRRENQQLIQVCQNNYPFKSSACIGKSCGLGSPNKYSNIYSILACGKGYVRFFSHACFSEKHPVRTITTAPHPNDFADMLFFSGALP